MVYSNSPTCLYLQLKSHNRQILFSPPPPTTHHPPPAPAPLLFPSNFWKWIPFCYLSKTQISSQFSAPTPIPTMLLMTELSGLWTEWSWSWSWELRGHGLTNLFNFFWEGTLCSTKGVCLLEEKTSERTGHTLHVCPGKNFFFLLSCFPAPS